MTPNDLFYFYNLKIIYWASFIISFVLFLISNGEKKIITKLLISLFASLLIALMIMIFSVPLGALTKFLLTKNELIESIYHPVFDHCDEVYDKKVAPYDYSQIEEDIYDVASEEEAIELALKQFKQKQFLFWSTPPGHFFKRMFIVYR